MADKDPDALTKEELAEQLGGFEDDNIGYLNYLEVHGAKQVDPLSPEGLRVQAEYLKQLGPNQHPFDVARRISLNPWCSPKDRLAAAKLLMDYTMRKVPAQVEMSTPAGQPIKLDNAQLKNLSNEDLEKLVNLISKANGE